MYNYLKPQTTNSFYASTMVKPPNRPKAAVIVATELRRQIVAGRMKPGDKLQPENILQAQFSVSRPTLREALRLLESESLITITRGKYGGARVSSVDLNNISSQVGVFLQIERTTLQDVWLARTVIEPPAAALLTLSGDTATFEKLDANIAEAREASKSDLMRYADLSADFSLIIMDHCGNNTLRLLGLLIFDIIRKQHEHITERTLSKPSVDTLRQDSIRNREEVVQLMRNGNFAAVERFWYVHLERMSSLVLSAYNTPTTIDVLNERAG
jgi:GntR family transcriptional repressor for pyruvate dehydrogenase complex|tara:strand:+ start:1791 stop:2603 length:813 start_codon:yes stop_codon:yes gene_type:complete